MWKNNHVDNKGFSLIELIVIVMIVGILSTTTIVGFAKMHDSDVTAARNNIVSMLTNARTTSIAKADNTIWFEITVDGDGDCYGTLYEGTKLTTSPPYNSKSATVLSNEKIGDDSLAVSVTDSKGSKSVVSSTKPITFEFDKSTGAMVQDFTDVTVTGTSLSKNIIVIQETGRCFREE